MKLLLQSFLLLLSFVLIFIWQESPASSFTLQAIGVLVAVYVAISIVAAQKNKRVSLGGALGIFILNTIIILFIFATGGLDSPFFFLLYLIILALVFVFEPYAIIPFASGVIMVFLPLALKGDLIGNLIKLGSVILISPLALYFGREYQKSEAEEVITRRDEIKEIKQSVEDVMRDEKEKLSKHDMQKLATAAKKAEELKEQYEDDF